MDPRERDAKLQRQLQKQALLDRAFDRVIGSQLDKIASTKTTSNQDEEAHRASLEQERDSKTKKKRRVSEKHLELASQGLSGQVVALMTKKDDEDDEKKKKRKKKDKKRKKRKRKYSSSGSDEEDKEERRERKRKKRKKESSRKKKKKRKKRDDKSESSSSSDGDSD